MRKYAIKSTEAAGHLSARITADTINSYRTLATHTARLIVTCWNLGHRPDWENPERWKKTYGRLRRWAHMLGHGGHHTTKSRRYSTTRKALKTARWHWQRARQYTCQTQHRTGDHTDDDTTLIVGNLTFAGIGYRTTGDQWLALTAAAQARAQRRVAKEERKVA